jgi:hypothetical protein
MDLLQGHYVTSVSRDMAVPGKSGLLETYAVSKFAIYWIFTLHMELPHCKLLNGSSLTQFTIYLM